MFRFFKRFAWLLIFVGIVGAVVYGFLPKPIPVDVAQVNRGDLAVTVSEDGKTRVRDRYVISSPLAGRLHRIKVRPGDPVATPPDSNWSDVPVARDGDPREMIGDPELDKANDNGHGGESLDSKNPPPKRIDPTAFQSLANRSEPFVELALIDPIDPVLLDSRQIAQAEMRVKATEATTKNSGAMREKAVVALEWARTDLGRRKSLAGKGANSKQELEDAEMLVRSRVEELNAAKFGEEIARYEFEVARAALLRSKPLPPGEAEKWQMRITSPINGVVMKVIQESETIVQQGTSLIEIGDPRDLEIDIEVLSTDAVKILPGQIVFLEHWGGEHPLKAHVRLVEPSGFMKMSALGVEEQRVHVIAQFDDPYSARPTLGDGYRVEAKIVIWEKSDVLKVPTGALFRDGDGWCAFVVKEGLAHKRRITIGRRNGLEAEVLDDSLVETDTVIVHPSDRIQNQTQVTPR